MITLKSDCLIFTLASGEIMPLSPEMLVGELALDSACNCDPEVLDHAASAVFHYFKHDLGMETVTMGEFAGAFDKVLRGLRLKDFARSNAVSPQLESDLCRMARESGEVSELFFFPLLRQEVRRQLEQTAGVVRFVGLRDCVKELERVRRWTPRCQDLCERIVTFIRECAQTDSPGRNCDLLVR